MKPKRSGLTLAPSIMVAALLAMGGAARSAPAAPWWHHALIYEIYPRSFADSNGDGVGDLNGIAAHLPDLQRLGVDAIWIAPIYPSPQVDFGYDISDYRAVDPQYGSLADLDRLQASARRHHIRLILDLVLNHTSDRHAWFRQSATSRTNAKADWYVWNDGVPLGQPGLSAIQRSAAHDGMAPPNNWTSSFGGSAWEWVPARRQFYYHRFYRQQPDLNWRNPAVEKAMLDVMRFWLDRGIAGFRLDAITSLFEDAQLRNEPETGQPDVFGAPGLEHIHTDNLPEQHEVIRHMRALVDSYPGQRVLIGETWLGNTAQMREWYGGAAQNELQLPMDMMLGFGGAPYTADWFRPRLQAAQTDLDGAQPLFVFDNHDSRRSIDRFGDGVHDVAIAKGIATILLASRATALTYYGAEIGMRTATPKRREDVRDPIGLTGWPRDKGRDGERTPMQWTPGPQAGFSTNPHTWLPVQPGHVTVNVATERADPQSLLRWHERLIALRRSEPALRDGAMTMLPAAVSDVLAWTRRSAQSTVLVAINMGATPRSLPGSAHPATLAASNGAAPDRGGTIALPPYAVWIGRVDAQP